MTTALNCFGLLFEPLVFRNLQIYAKVNDDKVHHDRDSRGLDIDVIKNGICNLFLLKGLFMSR